MKTMNTSDNYLEVNQQNDRLYESLYKQMISTEKWSKPDTQQDIEETKIPAFCLKTKDINTGQKLFINFCHSSMMKSPTLDLTEEELRSLLASEDSTAFTIPLLIKPFKPTKDKRGSKALVSDVIINTDFYINKISFSQLYKTFLITVTLETIEKDKYNGIIEKNDWLLLKNKKYQEVIAVNIEQSSGDKSLINDLSALLNINDINDDNNEGFNYKSIKTKTNNHNNVPETDSFFNQTIRQQTQTISNEEECVVSCDQIDGQSSLLTPRYKLKLDVFNNCMEGQVILPHVYDSNQLSLQIGEDRIVLKTLHYKLDIFVPVLIKSHEVVAVFDTFNNLLSIKMPLN